MSCEADKTDVDGSKAFLSPPSHKSKYIGGVGGGYAFSRNCDPEFSATGTYQIHLDKPPESQVLL